MTKFHINPLQAELDQALAHIRAVLPVTPLTHSVALSERLGKEIYLKWDNKFRTGSFKERGAVNVLSLLSAEERKRGVCAASAGNHALALSFHARRVGVPCTIVMPVQAPLVKVRATRNTGANVLLEGRTFDEAYEFALQLAAREKWQFISPFDDLRIVAGQATCGLEIHQQLPDLDTVVVPVGGGGLMSGIGLALKRISPHIHTVGVQSEWVLAGRRGEHAQALVPPVTIADGIAVKRAGKVTAPILSQVVDTMVTVSEDQVAQGIMCLLAEERTVVEGAGAAGVAAVLQGALPQSSKKVVIVVCGSNIDLNMLSRLIERDMGANDRLLKLAVSVPDRPGSLNLLTKILAEAGANVMEVLHDRSFSSVPGNVDISFVLEVRDAAHRLQVVEMLNKAGLVYKL